MLYRVRLQSLLSLATYNGDMLALLCELEGVSFFANSASALGPRVPVSLGVLIAQVPIGLAF